MRLKEGHFSAPPLLDRSGHIWVPGRAVARPPAPHLRRIK
jgi:hypothetical protein